MIGGEVADPDSLLEPMFTELRQAQPSRRRAKRLSSDLVLTAVPLRRNAIVWRVEEQARPRDQDVLDLPTLRIGADDTVLDANAAARRLLGKNADMVGLFCAKPPLKLGQFNDVRTEDGVVRCFVHAVDAGPQASHVTLLPATDVLAAKPDTWALLDELPVALLRLSSNGVIELSNPSARTILDVESGAGRRLSDLMEGPGRPIADWVRDAAEGRGTVQPETLQMRRKDKDVFVQVALNPVRDKGKTAVIAVLQDVTKLKSLELQFVQSQKMQAIGQLAGGVAHDFNNLLTAISGHCDLLLMRYGVDDPTYPDLMQISQNANRAAALVGQLLAYSRKQMLRPEIMNLRDMLADVTHLLNRLVGEKVRLTLRHDPDLWLVRADKRQLEQVLMNLVVNGRDAMPDGGEITIRTENLDLTEPLKRDRATVAPGRYVVVSVKDQGVGIDPGKLEKVFEPFYTSKKQGEGTGLGLSTAYGIVKQTGGFIFADSHPGKGAEFKIYLPAHDGAVEHATEKVPGALSVGRSDGVVMLVEDEAPVRAFACRALKMRGMSVIEAASGEEALEQLDDDTLRIDVIVTDVVMPGMDGPTWVAEARKTRPDVRVVFVSGYAADAVGDADAANGPSVFLPKPFSLTELVETVQTQMASQSRAS